MPTNDAILESLSETESTSATIVLVVAERKRRDGKYSAWHGGQLVVENVREPFLDAARVLLAYGLDPNARYVMRRSVDGRDDLVSTLGTAAKLKVEEGDRNGPLIRLWKPWMPFGLPEN